MSDQTLADPLLTLLTSNQTLGVETNLARGASRGVNFGWFETNMGSLSGGSNTTAVLAAIKIWNSAIAAGGRRRRPHRCGR
ncbi:hypothetical protein ACFRQM_31255 [Streptomyces sp. NPDC056831]|uniref:hypothetical protein n=1 Tax=Streptomyces sp. NPDC056831 TaxID=3345954 RepID=UPI0036CEABE1